MMLDSRMLLKLTAAPLDRLESELPSLSKWGK